MTARNMSLYQQSFESVQRNGTKDPRWFQESRSAGMENFIRQGFPGRKDEEWKFSDFRTLARTEFGLSVEEGLSFSSDEFNQLQFTDLNCPRLVLFNVTLCPELCSLPEVDGVTVKTLTAALHDSPDFLKEHLGQYAAINQNPFTALNSAFCKDGFVVHVNQDTVVESPLYLIHVTTNSSRPIRTHLRNLVVLGESSELTLVEGYLGTGDNITFTNPVTEVVVGANSTVHHYRLQNESRNGYHVSCNEVYQSQDSQYRTLSIDLGSQLARNDFRCVLDGEGSLAGIDGLYLLKERQHLDNYTTLEHRKSHCDSRELFKGVLDEKARGGFRGRIIVHEDAQKTDSKQTNKNLLLSDDSLANTKPQLEIYADDVKCTHGATIGQLDSEAMFYLRSRGIPEVAARNMLIYGFAGEVINRVKIDSLRGQLVKYLKKWLPKDEIIQGVSEG